MTWRLVFLLGALALSIHTLSMRGLAQSVPLVQGSPSSNVIRLSLKDAEALALMNNPSVYTRAAGGATVSQLITDFGHTTNLVAGARLQARADEQSAVATKQDTLLAVDQAFYNALQTHAVLHVAEQTVAARQLLSDQVSALTKSKLRSDLDLSFANVNLAQAKLLYLDALNNDKASMAALSAILGYPTLETFELVNETEPLAPPPAEVDPLI